MSAWLTILGVGDDGVEGLSPPARALFDGAQIVVGWPRILKSTDLSGKETCTWTSPIEDMLEQIREWKDRGVVVLSTGDPMNYGIGARLAAHVPADEMTVIPAPFFIPFPQLFFNLFLFRYIAKYSHYPDSTFYLKKRGSMFHRKPCTILF